MRLEFTLVSINQKWTCMPASLKAWTSDSASLLSICSEAIMKQLENECTPPSLGEEGCSDNLYLLHSFFSAFHLLPRIFDV